MWEDLGALFAEKLLYRARDVVQGDAEERALRRVWQRALAATLREMAPQIDAE